MDIINSKITANGKLRLVVELEPSESLMVIRQDAFYRLGYPFDEVVQSHTLEAAELVTWCPIEQMWIS